MKKIVLVLVLLFTTFLAFSHDGRLFILDGLYQFTNCATLKPGEFRDSGITFLKFIKWDGVSEAGEDGGPEVIPEYCFADNTKLEFLIIPSSVRRIEAGAFKECSWMESLTFLDNGNEGVEYIGPEAFAGNRNFRKLVLPKSLKIMSQNSFTFRSREDPGNDRLFWRGGYGIEEVWIGDDVEIEGYTGWDNINRSFTSAYVNNGRKAGWYRFAGTNPNSHHSDPYWVYAENQ